jgi:hypothetical protein
MGTCVCVLWFHIRTCSTWWVWYCLIYTFMGNFFLIPVLLKEFYRPVTWVMGTHCRQSERWVSWSKGSIKNVSSEDDHMEWMTPLVFYWQNCTENQDFVWKTFVVNTQSMEHRGRRELSEFLYVAPSSFFLLNANFHLILSSRKSQTTKRAFLLGEIECVDIIHRDCANQAPP